jgi:hypothetical protein
MDGVNADHTRVIRKMAIRRRQRSINGYYRLERKLLYGVPRSSAPQGRTCHE